MKISINGQIHSRCLGGILPGLVEPPKQRRPVRRWCRGRGSTRSRLWLMVIVSEMAISAHSKPLVRQMGRRTHAAACSDAAKIALLRLCSWFLHCRLLQRFETLIHIHDCSMGQLQKHCLKHAALDVGAIAPSCPVFHKRGLAAILPHSTPCPYAIRKNEKKRGIKM